MRCTTGPGWLAASLWLSRNTGESRLPRTPRDGAAPHVTLTVRLADLSEAELADMKAELAEQAATEAGNLERCIAWAWLITQEHEA